MMFVTRAAEILLRGGIIAYPTEGVFGLGCLPDDVEAVERLLEVKRRDTRKGLILIASIVEQLPGNLDRATRPQRTPDYSRPAREPGDPYYEQPDRRCTL
jgi:L-threonylcarbamoyladenylate synthase